MNISSEIYSQIKTYNKIKFISIKTDIRVLFTQFKYLNYIFHPNINKSVWNILMVQVCCTMIVKHQKYKFLLVPEMFVMLKGRHNVFTAVLFKQMFGLLFMNWGNPIFVHAFLFVLFKIMEIKDKNTKIRLTNKNKHRNNKVHIQVKFISRNISIN